VERGEPATEGEAVLAGEEEGDEEGRRREMYRDGEGKEKGQVSCVECSRKLSSEGQELRPCAVAVAVGSGSGRQSKMLVLLGIRDEYF